MIDTTAPTIRLHHSLTITPGRAVTGTLSDRIAALIPPESIKPDFGLDEWSIMGWQLTLVKERKVMRER